MEPCVSFWIEWIRSEHHLFLTEPQCGRVLPCRETGVFVGQRYVQHGAFKAGLVPQLPGGQHGF